MHKNLLLPTLFASFSLTAAAVASNSSIDQEGLRAFAMMPRVHIGTGMPKDGLKAMANCYQHKGRKVSFADQSPRNRRLADMGLTRDTLSAYLSDTHKTQPDDGSLRLHRRVGTLTLANLRRMEELTDSESSSASQRSVSTEETATQGSWFSRLRGWLTGSKSPSTKETSVNTESPQETLWSRFQKRVAPGPMMFPLYDDWETSSIFSTSSSASEGADIEEFEDQDHYLRTVFSRGK